MVNRMSKTKLIAAVSILTSASAVAYDQSAKVIEYCDAGGYDYSHEITIDELHGVGTLRNGYLLVTEQSESDELKWQLLKSSSLLTDPNDCLTYISNLGIAKYGEATDKGYLVARIHFDFDKFNLSRKAQRVLKNVATELSNKGYHVTVEGHTDWVGSDSYNQALGFRRAQSTAGELNRYGVTKENTTLKSFGESEPIVSNKTSDGRSQNRRSDVYIPLDSDKDNSPTE